MNKFTHRARPRPVSQRWRSASPQAQRGFTLIELMVAIAIALFMTAAIIMVYLNMHRSNTSQNQISTLQENRRLVLTFMSNTIQAAGFFPINATDTATKTAADVFKATSDISPTFASGQVIAEKDLAAAGGELGVRFQSVAGDGQLDCTGASTASATSVQVVNTYAVNASNELTCSVNGGDPVVLASGVKSLSVLYGVDLPETAGSEPDGSVDTWLARADVTSWSAVRTIQIRLKFIDPLRSTNSTQAEMENDLVQNINLMSSI
ncbi:prepilin-type N-terminal cleavage/methylation domain-containing protein [Ottowia testudinis]|uniref:Prepilin-type N-terminal cleavage/methylation domain-containing protein n=1 Tax=Ottowia testudinis TaxID=2816950 RepID=A0A975CGZ9_9BURK|nr:prepilin-type N-terminal cleavage/methylation domain-containing protein [Ottowia testudinis]QTD46268.1 prepilin-type N-terminal cleavage/methylation domain-containing protein [Ottowia testudinis]